MIKNFLVAIVFCFFTTSCMALETDKLDTGSTGEVGEILDQVTENVLNSEQKAFVTDAWARKSASPNNNSAAYMKINNPTQKQVTIIGASAPMVANNVELHKSFVDERGISRMVSIDKIVVPAESSVELSPGGIHIMLFDLKRQLVENDKFQLTLSVSEGEPIVTEVTVSNK